MLGWAGAGAGIQYLGDQAGVRPSAYVGTGVGPRAGTRRAHSHNAGLGWAGLGWADRQLCDLTVTPGPGHHSPGGREGGLRH